MATGNKSRRVARFSESIVIKVQPSDAFAYLGNPETATIIDPAVLSYLPDTVPMAVGTINTVKVRMFGLRLTTVTRVLIWDAGRRMVIESVRPSRPVKGIATHTFDPHPEGTLYTWSMEIVPTFVGGRFFAAFFCRFMRMNARRQQARFKQAMEISEAVGPVAPQNST
jgi:hypothetical protein